jgi:hypothetical protein
MKKQRTETNKLQRRARTYSFTAGQHDSIRVARSKREPVPAMPNLPEGPKRATANDEDDGNGFWQRVPTLHNRKNGKDMPRRKSSKRRREDVDREAEIKAMSNFMPVRPATDDWTAGRPMKKDSKRVRTVFGLGKQWENPSSDISLPIPESIHSSMSSDSEYASYKIGALEALAPRPTLRYTAFPRWGPPSGGSYPTRTSSERRKLADRPIPEATLKAHKRVDDLADDLDASDLRELMERDNRRREKKRQREQDRLERRLARKAEKQRAAEAAAAENGTSPPQNLERGVLGREAVGLGIDPASAVLTSSKRRPSNASPNQLGKMPEGSASAEETEIRERKPHEQFHRMDSIPLETPAPKEVPVEEKPAREKTTDGEAGEEAKPPPIPVLSPKRNLLRSKKSRSRSPPMTEQERSTASLTLGKADSELDTKPKVSESGHKGRLSFSSLFRWGGKSKRGSGQSSFANTSREEMQAAAAQTPPVAPAPPPPAVSTRTFMPARKLSSGVPKRTISRFREDLPELPLSPPDSRVQSPEAEPSLPIVAEQKSGDISEPSTPLPIRFDTPTSGHRSMDEAMRQTPTSWHHGGAQGHSPEPPSISMASIDSEASWLSGRLTGKRSSGMRENASRYHQHERTNSDNSTMNNTEDDLAIVDDEYLNRLSPPLRHHNQSVNPNNRKSTGEARPSSDEDEPMEDADMKWGSVDARQQPLMVHEHDASMVKSREGLLNTFNEEDDESDNVEDGGIGEKLEEAGLQRATSVNLGRGHARHISAGSAKLLELSPRGSVEMRKSSDNRRSSGLAFL